MPSDLTEFEQAGADEDSSRLLARLAAAQLKQQQAARAVKELTAEAETRERLVTTLQALDGVRAKPPVWRKPKRKDGRHVGVANMLLSDLHLDEVVNPAEVGGVNGYNRRIAELRLKAAFDKFLVVSRDYISGIDFDGAVIAMLGDTFSGNIHEELRETNEAGILESVDHWIDLFVAGLTMVADDMGVVHVPCIAGNHGRNTAKPIHKGSVRDNYDWLFARQLARALRDDSRITFDIPDSTWTQHTQYGTTFHYEHGDRGFSGGGGIAGIFSPLLRGDLKLRKRQTAIARPYDVLCLGHFHTYLPVPSFGFIANGSTKGYDEYAASLKLGFEPPQQAYWITTPSNAVTFTAPLLVCDRKAEGW